MVDIQAREVIQARSRIRPSNTDWEFDAGTAFGIPFSHAWMVLLGALLGEQCSPAEEHEQR